MGGGRDTRSLRRSRVKIHQIYYVYAPLNTLSLGIYNYYLILLTAKMYQEEV